MIRITTYPAKGQTWEWEGSCASDWTAARRAAKKELKRPTVDRVKLEDDKRGEVWRRHLTKKFQKEEYRHVNR